MKRLIAGLGLLFVFALPMQAKVTECIAAGQPVAPTSGIYFIGGTVPLPAYQAGTTPAVFSMPVYIYCNINKDVAGMFTTLPSLADGNGNTIPITYSYTSIPSGTEVPIAANTWVEILPNGEPQLRDGATIVGYINIIAPALPITQVSGSYTTGAISADIALDAQTIPSTQLGSVTLNGSVDEFIIMGFADTSLLGTGVYFVGEIIDFGIFVAGFAHPPITKNLFVHTNRDANIQITFSNTPPLLSLVDGVSTIGMTYSYNLNGVSATIIAGVPFVAISGVNGGTASVGTITFAPDAIPGIQTQGAYSATVNVIVSAQ